MSVLRDHPCIRVRPPAGNIALHMPVLICMSSRLVTCIAIPDCCRRYQLCRPVCGGSVHLAQCSHLRVIVAPYTECIFTYGDCVLPIPPLRPKFLQVLLAGPWHKSSCCCGPAASICWYVITDICLTCVAEAPSTKYLWFHLIATRASYSGSCRVCITRVMLIKTG
jgi:hypothetical protein